MREGKSYTSVEGGTALHISIMVEEVEDFVFKVPFTLTCAGPTSCKYNRNITVVGDNLQLE